MPSFNQIKSECGFVFNEIIHLTLRSIRRICILFQQYYGEAAWKSYITKEISLNIAKSNLQYLDLSNKYGVKSNKWMSWKVAGQNRADLCLCQWSRRVTSVRTARTMLPGFCLSLRSTFFFASRPTHGVHQVPLGQVHNSGENGLGSGDWICRWEKKDMLSIM